MTTRGAVPWWPECMPAAAGSAADARRRWAYVSLEEIVDGAAELVRWPWPLADRDGRLVWDDDVESRVEVRVVPVTALHTFMYKPSGLARMPRCGDVFAVEVRGSTWAAADDGVPPDELLRQLFGGLVVDVSAAAREAAKLAYHAANAAVFDGSEVRESLTRARRSRKRAAPTMTVTRT